MSTNQKLTNDTTTSTSNAGNQAGEKKPKKALDLSVPQIVGGALAAMTAAALGSQLSVAGTVVGAALASIIAAVAGSLYTASIRRTSDKVKTVFWTGQPNEVEEPTVMEILPGSEGHVAGQRSHLLEPQPAPAPRGPKLNWKRVAVGGTGRIRHRGSLADRGRAGHWARPLGWSGHHDPTGQRGQAGQGVGDQEEGADQGCDDQGNRHSEQHTDQRGAGEQSAQRDSQLQA